LTSDTAVQRVGASTTSRPQASTSWLTRWFDHWMFVEFDLAAADLGIFRIIWALAALLLFVQDVELVNAYPDTFYSPGPGLMAVFTGLPPHWVPVALELGIAITVVAILVGYQTMIASFGVTVLWMYASGIISSVGKVNHFILLFVIAPPFLALAGWGSRYSVDAWLRTSRPRPVRRWALVLFAFTIGCMFVTAAIPKIQAGWLDLSTHAVHRDVIAAGSKPPFASAVRGIHAPALWESMDLATIALECGVLLSCLSLRWWRALLSTAVFFHIGIWLLVGPYFTPQVIMYGAYVPWARLLRVERWPKANRLALARPRPSVRAVLAPGVVIAGGLFVREVGLFDTPRWLLTRVTLDSVNRFVFTLAGIFAVTYLVFFARSLARSISRHLGNRGTRGPQRPPGFEPTIAATRL
jgi:Vitamin K-dependent gamma-carboxylase